MKRYTTEREESRVITVILLIIYVIVMSILLVMNCFVENLTYYFVLTSVVYIVVNLPFFLIWFPYYYKRKKAINEGEHYIGFVTGKEYVANAYKMMTKQNKVMPRLQITYINDLCKKHFFTDAYVDYGRDGSMYSKCDVYYYKGKNYVTNVFYDSSKEEYDKFRRQILTEKYGKWQNKKDRVKFLEFRNQEALICSNKSILIPDISIMKDDKLLYVLVEIKLLSTSEYSYTQMDILEKLESFARGNVELYFGGRKAEYLVGVKSFIFDFWKDNMPEYSKVDDVLVDIIDIQ